jgi:MFS family permease
MTAASGLAVNFWQMGLARVFVAFGEATLTPAAVAMLGDVFRPRQRALASGLYYLGIPLGASCSLIVANLLWPVPWIGWRGCFFILGAIGLVVVVPVLLVKDPRRGGTEDQPARIAERATDRGPSITFFSLVGEILSALRTTPALPLTMVSGMLINISVGATWLDSSWLNAERGFTKQGAPIFLGCIFLFGGSLGNVLGGWLGDRFNRLWSGGRLLALVALQLAVCPFTIAFRFLPGEFRLGLGVCWFFGSILVTCMYGPVLATVQELTPVRLRATMVAFLLIGLNIAGASLGAVIAAWLTDVLDSYTWGIFVTSLASLLSIPLLCLAFRRYSTDLARLAC